MLLLLAVWLMVGFGYGLGAVDAEEDHSVSLMLFCILLWPICVGYYLGVASEEQTKRHKEEQEREQARRKGEARAT